MGRFSPAVEHIRLPPGELEGGSLVNEWSDTESVTNSTVRPRAQRLVNYAIERIRGKEEIVPEGKVAIELRQLAPANWSHSVNHHLLQSLLIRRNLVQSEGALGFLVVLPDGIPGYITNLYEIFGFTPLVTDLPVRGRVASFHEEPFSCHRAVMTELVAELVHQDSALQHLFEIRQSLPKKIFLSRRDTRRLSNEDAVEAFLKERGFSKIYPETLSIPEQFGLFAHATHLVGVHGAGLGPLAYRPVGEPCRFVEILSPGHMTDFYRFVAHQIGASWVGVRGCLWPELVNDAYRFSEPFKKHSLADFAVELESLEVALDLAETRASQLTEGERV